MNILLNNTQRKKYESTIKQLTDLCPETISRKIPEANVQQAFTFSQTLEHSQDGAKILCVGSHEDTACEALIKMGLNVTPIDPETNYSLGQFFNRTKEKFDVIFSTSVIEHVPDDETFIAQICQLLSPNGVAILTCDFRDDYKPGDPKPGEDVRLYTTNDLLVRLKKVIEVNGCQLEGKIDYKGNPDFQYGLHTYSFATLVFRKS